MRKTRIVAAMLALGLIASLASISRALAVPLLKAVKVATVTQPVAMAVRTGDSAIYFAEKTGKVRALSGGVVQPGAVLDLTGQLNTGGEQGLLGIAFSPDGTKLFAYFNDTPAGNIHLAEFTMQGSVALPSSRREVLFIDHHQYNNHNGGNIVFGPDGYLYIGTGDGGGGGDPLNSGQRLDTLLGKMLRIDPLHGSPYAIPPTNPFVNRPPALPEIWAFGLRNPWRWSFDRITGDLWIGDVGQNTWEEVDYQPASSRGGENYGWNRLEGNHPYQGDPPPGAKPAVYEYNHAGGNCSITGGYLYRGTAIPALVGSYVYADFCAGRVQALMNGGLIIVPFETGVTISSPASFGQDSAGELYVLSLGGDVFKLVPLT